MLDRPLWFRYSKEKRAGGKINETDGRVPFGRAFLGGVFAGCVFQPEPSSSEDGNVLVEERGVTVTYAGMEMTEEGNAELKMTVENNSEQPILVNVQDFSANGIMMSPFFATQVTPGKKSNGELTIYANTLEENGVTAVESVEFSLVVFNDDTLDIITETDLLTLTM